MATYNPSETQYRELQYAFRRINKRLFKGALPNCLLTLQRKPRTRGYMSPAKFESRKNSVTVLDEIAINPAEMPEMTDAAILATLALNMCRVWQVHFGKPGRGRYINKELADRMQVIGMISSSTGKPGGKRTGQHTGGYVQAGGPLDKLIKDILTTGWRFEFQDRQSAKREKDDRKVHRHKYQCPNCELAAWARPLANLICGDCALAMPAVGRV